MPAFALSRERTMDFRSVVLFFLMGVVATVFSTHPPVFFAPGFSGNSLHATVHALPSVCPSWILHQSFQLWPNVALYLWEECFLEVARLQYDPVDHLYKQPGKKFLRFSGCCPACACFEVR
jgi:hypothetical protein